jgi:hypothetical protein
MDNPLFGFLKIESVSDVAAAERELEKVLTLANQTSSEPEVYVPFTVEKKTAIEAFHKWLQSLSFVPAALKRTADLGALKPIFVPFWAVHSMTYTSYQGERGENEKYTEQYTDASGQTHNRDATRVAWRPAWGEVRQHFEALYVCGVEDLPAAHVGVLTPRELKNHQRYSQAALGDTPARRSDLNARTAFTKARKQMEEKVKALVNKDIGGVQQKVSRMDTRHVGVAVKHLLIPAFEGAYRFAGKEYKVLINGATGEVAGDYPLSAGKIIVLILSILLGLAAIIGLIVFFATRK